MTKEEMDKVIEGIMREVSEQVAHTNCNNSDSQCNPNNVYKDSSNQKRLKKGIYCGIKPHYEQNQTKK